MITFESTKEKKIIIEVDTTNVDPSNISYTLTLTRGNICFTFPGTYANRDNFSTISFVIPPLDEVISQIPLGESEWTMFIEAKAQVNNTNIYWYKIFENTVSVLKTQTSTNPYNNIYINLIDISDSEELEENSFSEYDEIEIYDHGKTNINKENNNMKNTDACKNKKNNKKSSTTEKQMPKPKENNNQTKQKVFFRKKV